MSLKTTFALALMASAIVGTWAQADEGIMIKDPYARAARPGAPTGAAFMTIMNHSDHDIRLIGAHSDVAKKVELHTHKENAEGVMQMLPIQGGIVIPAGEAHMLKRGGDHVMFMGLKETLVQDETVSVTLEFEKAGALVVEVPVDHARKTGHGMKHSAHAEHQDH